MEPFGNGGPLQVQCGYLPQGVSGAQQASSPLRISFVDLSGTSTAASSLASLYAYENASRCNSTSGGTVAGCSFDLRYTPGLGPGTFLYYTSQSGTDGGLLADCNVVVRDFAGTPLEETIRTANGGSVHFTGSQSESTLCGWAVAIMDLMM